MSKVNFRKTTISSIVLFCFSLMFAISAEAITLGSATDLLKKKKDAAEKMKAGFHLKLV